jgi:hypothetical protein
MSKSLIRKNQLHPDIGDLVTGYGLSIFSKLVDFNQLSGNLLNIVALNRLITVLTTGDQTVSGLKNFVIRPTVNNTGVLLEGEIPLNILYTTGAQTITSPKDFTVRPTVNNTGVLLEGEIPLNILYTTGAQTISGIKTFQNSLTTPEIRGTGLGGLFRKIDLQEGHLYSTVSISLNYWDRILSGQWKTNQRLLVNNTGVLLSGDAVESNGTITKMIALTQNEYNTLSPKNPTTFYVIVDPN